MRKRNYTVIAVKLFPVLIKIDLNYQVNDDWLTDSYIFIYRETNCCFICTLEER